jgi:uncharacterized protein involved in outer membrane biogenesis
VSRFLRFTVRAVATLFAVLILAVVVVALVPFSIDLTRFKGPVEAAATGALGRAVAIDGEIRASTSLWPTLEMEGVRLTNPAGFGEGDLARMDEASVQVELLPLLVFKLQIGKFRVRGLSLDLVRDGSGRANWALERDAEPVDEEPPPAESDAFDPRSISGDALVLDELSLADISVSYRNADMEEPLRFTLESLEGQAPEGEPFAFEAHGKLMREPFRASLKASSLEALVRDNRADTALEIEIAGTQFRLGGLVDLNVGMRSASLRAGVEGKALQDLDELLGVDLPPLRDYLAEAELTLTPENISISDLELRVGGSKLTGTAKLNRKGRRSFTALFTSPSIRIEDFDLGDWSPSAADPVEQAEAEAPAEEVPSHPDGGAGETSDAVVKLFDPVLLGRFDARVELEVQQVSSGGNQLGAGRFVASLDQGRLAIDPLTLALPGGNFLLVLSIKPGAEASAASLRILIENFDLGVIARRKKPESKTEGSFSVDVDLEASARNLEALLAGASGHLHFTAHPRNLEAGIIDLWAVNVLSAVVSSSADENADEPPESQINCVINRWQMNDGVLSSETMIVDTTRIRICGQGEVDFHAKTLRLVVAPTAKRPEFFSLATPIEVDGTFADFGIGTYGAGIPGTAVRFITSPVATPMFRAVSSDLPEDGGDVCATPIGPSFVAPKRYPGCRDPWR